jgi:hypothetical protein
MEYGMMKTDLECKFADFVSPSVHADIHPGFFDHIEAVIAISNNQLVMYESVLGNN